MNDVLFPVTIGSVFGWWPFLYGASGSHSLDLPHFVGPLWTSDQPDAESK